MSTGDNTAGISLEDLKAKYMEQQSKQSACPNCGYCPHCGRGGYETYPYYPRPYWSPYLEHSWITYCKTNTAEETL